MKIGVPKELEAGETRVALTPDTVRQIVKNKHEVVVQKGAGEAASFSDEEYTKAGASIAPAADAVYGGADVIVKVRPPAKHGGVDETALVKPGTSYVGFLHPAQSGPAVKSFLSKKVTSYAMEYVPRITRAQSMDALSSMATLAGYKAVIIAADHLPKIYPMMMTAAGTIKPAAVLVLGAGVAGLQAIATAKRLGARVEAFDPRPAVRDQVKSLGAAFVEMEQMEGGAETAGGYAKEQSEEFLRKEREAIGGRLPKTDVVISTAQVFGKKAPVLIDAAMVKMMHPGGVIVDLAAEQGGNCELTTAGKTTVHSGVTIIGAVNLPATMPVDASAMYAKNIQNLIQQLFGNGPEPDAADEIVRGCCITRGGEIVNESYRSSFRPD